MAEPIIRKDDPMNTTRTWKCPDCGTTTEISYDWLAEHGGPVCEKCDCDMELQPEASRVMIVPLSWNDWSTRPTPPDCNQRISMSWFTSLQPALPPM